MAWGFRGQQVSRRRARVQIAHQGVRPAAPPRPLRASDCRNSASAGRMALNQCPAARQGDPAPLAAHPALSPQKVSPRSPEPLQHRGDVDPPGWAGTGHDVSRPSKIRNVRSLELGLWRRCGQTSECECCALPLPHPAWWTPSLPTRRGLHRAALIPGVVALGAATNGRAHLGMTPCWRPVGQLPAGIVPVVHGVRQG